MNVSADAPYLDMAYKLVRYDGRNVLKLSMGKETWTGEKQVYRARQPDGRFDGDVIALREEAPPAAAREPLLREVMRGGNMLDAHPSLAAIREHCAAQLRGLPEEVRRLRHAGAYPVRYSERLRALQQSLEAEAMAREVTPSRPVVGG